MSDISSRQATRLWLFPRPSTFSSTSTRWVVCHEEWLYFNMNFKEKKNGNFLINFCNNSHENGKKESCRFLILYRRLNWFFQDFQFRSALMKLFRGCQNAWFSIRKLTVDNLIGGWRKKIYKIHFENQTLTFYFQNFKENMILILSITDSPKSKPSNCLHSCYINIE